MFIALLVDLFRICAQAIDSHPRLGIEATSIVTAVRQPLGVSSQTLDSVESVRIAEIGPSNINDPGWSCESEFARHRAGIITFISLGAAALILACYIIFRN